MIDAKRSSSNRETFERDGFLAPLRLMTTEEAAAHRARFEQAEHRHGRLHYLSKVHTIVADAARIATDTRILDVVEALIGPDILLFDVTYIVKEPCSGAFVSWHQDLTYWGFSGDQQVTVWVALSPATQRSGCMRMVPGSHRAGRREHRDVDDRDNVLHRGQTVADVAEATAVWCPLQPGEASFHHGWTLHASTPNQSDDRRIGVNIQYIAPAMKQELNTHETALLVRGRDAKRHYASETLATTDFDPEAVVRHARLDRLRKDTWDQAAARSLSR
jgi:ectoine hydroxylase-related dioxygenase (phytanoyl-CoA dioxygenase family)